MVSCVLSTCSGGSPRALAAPAAFVAAAAENPASGGRPAVSLDWARARHTGHPHTQLLLPPKRACTRTDEEERRAEVGDACLKGRAALRLRAPFAPQNADEAEEVMRRALIVVWKGGCGGLWGRWIGEGLRMLCKEARMITVR